MSFRWIRWALLSNLVYVIVTQVADPTTAEDQEQIDYELQQEQHPEYAFSYGVKDLHTGDVKTQWESRDGDSIRGHYSVLEPDGSIRTVHYTADAKSGFNAIVKTVGANSHPITETPHGENNINDNTSQSKINHYSKDQEHIVLSSDINPVKDVIEDLTLSHPEIPSLIEFHPHARIKQVPMNLLERMHARPSAAQDEKELDHITVPYDEQQNDWRAMVIEETTMHNQLHSQDYKSTEDVLAPRNIYPRNPLQNDLRTYLLAANSMHYHNPAPSVSNIFSNKNGPRRNLGPKHYNTYTQKKQTIAGYVDHLSPHRPDYHLIG